MLERSAGKYSLLWEVELRLRADRAYDFVTEKDPFLVSFHDIGNGRFVGQAKADTPPTYGYGVMRRDGSVILCEPSAAPSMRMLFHHHRLGNTAKPLA